MKNKKTIIQIITVLLLLIFGVIGFLALKSCSQKPQMQTNSNGESKNLESLPKAFVIKAEKNDHKVYITGQGTVKPLHEINLIPQVNGEVVYASKNFVNGGTFKKNEILIKINPIDYELTVTSADAKVKSSASEYYLAREESLAAKEEWNLAYGKNSNKKLPPLVAKQPQLEAALAALKANQADLEKAKLQLERCEIRAPFDGRVGNKNIDVGQYVSAGQNLGSIFSIEVVEISIPLADEELGWFDVPGFTSEDKQADVLINANIAGQNKIWKGKLVRTEGKIDEQTRMIKVVVRVENPYKEKPPLAIGLFVSVKIIGRTLFDTLSIPRSSLREDNIVWVVDEDNRLNFRKVEVAKISGDQAIIQNSFSDSEYIVTGRMKIVSDGMFVRKIMVNRKDEK